MDVSKEGTVTSQPLTILRIQHAVAEHWGVPVDNLQSPRRQPAIAIPRQVGIFLARELTQASFDEIAQAFGRDRSTVLHACAHIARRMEEDARLAHRIWSLRQALSS